MDSAANSPNHCFQARLKYSRDRRFVRVEGVSTKCPGYGGNSGFTFLHRTGKSWTEVFDGSSYPPCSLGIPAELTRCDAVE